MIMVGRMNLEKLQNYPKWLECLWFISLSKYIRPCNSLRPLRFKYEITLLASFVKCNTIYRNIL